MKNQQRLFSFIVIFVFITLSCEDSTKDKTYLEKREFLVNRDANLRFDSEIELNQEEKALDAKLEALRLKMVHHYDSIGYFPPQEPFNDVKAHIEKTPLFSLLRNMPKGGILHLHNGASLDFRWVVEKAVNSPNCYIYWGEDSDDYNFGQIHFFKDDSVPDGFVRAKELNDQHPTFKSELLELLIFREEPQQDSLDTWIEFENIFQRVHGFVSYKPIFKEFHRAMFDSLIADGIQHAEMRRIFRGSLYDLQHSAQSGYYNADSTVQLVKEVVKEIQEDHPNFSYTSIYTFLRFMPRSQVLNELVKAYELRKKYPDFIRGFDLVAEEENGHTTLFFLDVWEKMDSLNKVYGIDMPLFLHDGESTWASIQNLYDANLLNSKRIGHGFNLMHFPSLVTEIREKDICLEVNPLSNQLLGYVKDLRLHPASLMLKHGIQCVISSDDPAIFNYNGLTYDFWTIVLAWELDLRSLKKLAQNSLAYSTLPEAEKKKALASWESSWQSFVEYGNEYLDEIN